MSKWLRLIVFLLLFPVGSLHGQEVSLPVDLQYPLFLKILSFDRNLPDRAGDEIVIGVVYQNKFRTSRSIKDNFLENFEHSAPPSTVHGLPIRCVSIDAEGLASLVASLDEQKVDILYITPLRALNISDIAALSQKRGIITLSASPGYIEAGLSVAIGQKENRPQIIINKTSADLEGANFSARLLGLAQVIDN